MDTESKYEYLTEIELFSVLDDKTLHNLATLFTAHNTAKNDFLFEEGSSNNWIYFVIEGRIKLLAHSSSGKDVILKIAEEYDLLTDTGVLFGNKDHYSYSAQALEDSKVLKINATDFKNILTSNPDSSINMIELLDEYLSNTYEIIKEMALEKVERRIALNLLKLAKKTGKRIGDGIKLEIKLSRQDLANLTGTTIETAIRIMSKFKKEKIITEEKGYITIAKRHQLVLISEEYKISS